MSSENLDDRISISTDKNKLDIDFIYGFLSTAYWSAGRSRETVERSIANSLCFGVYIDGIQVGFARVITDYSVFAYLADVFIAEDYRKNGLSKLLLQYILSFPALSPVKRWMLATADAHGLYRKFGFNDLERPDKFMERLASTQT